MARTVAWGVQDDDAVAALQLSRALKGGWRPPEATAPIAMFDGEFFVSTTAFDLLEYANQSVPYSQGMFVAFGNPLFLAASLGGSILVNRSRQRRAEAQAAPQWRRLASGSLHVTSQRFGLQGDLGWHEIAYVDVRASECHTDGIVLWLPNRPPIKVVVAWPAYLFVLFNFLAYGHTVGLSLPEELRTRANALGKALPA